MSIPKQKKKKHSGDIRTFFAAAAAAASSTRKKKDISIKAEEKPPSLTSSSDSELASNRNQQKTTANMGVLTSKSTITTTAAEATGDVVVDLSAKPQARHHRPTQSSSSSSLNDKKKPAPKKARSSITKPSVAKKALWPVAAASQNRGRSLKSPINLMDDDEVETSPPAVVQITATPFAAAQQTRPTTPSKRPLGSCSASPIDLTPQKSKTKQQTSRLGSTAASPIDLTPSANRADRKKKRTAAAAATNSSSPSPPGSSAASPIDLTPSHKSTAKRSPANKKMSPAQRDLLLGSYTARPIDLTQPTSSSSTSSLSSKKAKRSVPERSVLSQSAAVSAPKKKDDKTAARKPATEPAVKQENREAQLSPASPSPNLDLQPSTAEAVSAVKQNPKEQTSPPADPAALSLLSLGKTPTETKVAKPIAAKKTLTVPKSTPVLAVPAMQHSTTTPSLTTPPALLSPKAAPTNTSSGYKSDLPIPSFAPPPKSKALLLQQQLVPKPTKNSVCRVQFDASGSIFSKLRVLEDKDGRGSAAQQQPKRWFPATVLKVAWKRNRPNEAKIDLKYFDGSTDKVEYRHYDTVAEMRNAEPQDMEMLVPVKDSSSSSKEPIAYRVLDSEELALNQDPKDLEVGDFVQARWRGGTDWFCGRCVGLRRSDVDSGLMCDIFYDDQDYEVGIPVSYVHVLERGAKNPGWLLGLPCLTSKGQKEIEARIVAVEPNGGPVKVKQEGGKVARMSYRRAVDSFFRFITAKGYLDKDHCFQFGQEQQQQKPKAAPIKTEDAQTESAVKPLQPNDKNSASTSEKDCDPAKKEAKKKRSSRPRTTKPASKRRATEIKPKRRKSNRRANHKFETVTEEARAASIELYVPRGKGQDLPTSAKPAPQKEIGPTISCAVQKALQSSEDHLSSELFRFMAFHHNQGAPDVGLCRVLLKFALEGPVSGSTHFPDCQKVERAREILDLCLSKNPRNMDRLITVSGDLWTNCMTCLTSRHYMAEGDETRNTHFALDRLAQTVHLKAVCAEFLARVLEHELGAFIRDGVGGHNQPELLQQTIVKEICGHRRGSKQAVEQVLDLLQQSWALLGQFTTSVATPRTSDGCVSEDSLGFLQEKSSLLLKQLGKISSYILWLHRFMEDESVASLAHLVRNSSSLLFEEGGCALSPFCGEETLGDQHWSKVRLNLVLGLDARIVPAEVRPILADLFDVGDVFNVIFSL